MTAIHRHLNHRWSGLVIVLAAWVFAPVTQSLAVEDEPFSYARAAEDARASLFNIRRQSQLLDERRPFEFAADLPIPVFITQPKRSEWLPSRIEITANQRPILSQDLRNITASLNGSTPSPATWEIGEIPTLNSTTTIDIWITAATPDGRSVTTQDRLENVALTSINAIEVLIETGELLANTTLKTRLLKHPSENTNGIIKGVLALTDDEDSYLPGSNQDPALRAATTLHQSGDAEAALIALLQIQKSLDVAQLVPADLLEAMVRSSVDLGLLTKASEYLALIREQPVKSNRLAELHVLVARHYYLRADYSLAKSLLSHIDPSTALEHQLQWQEVMARSLLKLDLENQAAKAYKQRENIFYEAQRNLQQPLEARRLAAYSYYNRGVAYIRAGDASRGRTWLDVAGRETSEDELSLALKDRANATLGWELLKQKQGTTAATVFSRIRLDGPFSNVALLGAGWSLFGMTGTQVSRMERTELGVEGVSNQMPAFVADALKQRRVLDNNLYGPQSMRRQFGQTKKPKDKQEAAERALVYWQSLITQPIHDPAVQEGLVAHGYAWQILGDGRQAASAYQQAKTALDQAMSEIQSLRKTVSDSLWVRANLRSFRHAELSQVKSSNAKTDPWISQAIIRELGVMRLENYFLAESAFSDITKTRSRLNVSSELPRNNNDMIKKEITKLLETLTFTETNLTASKTAEEKAIAKQIDTGLARQEEQIRKYLQSALAGYLDVTQQSLSE